MEQGKAEFQRLWGRRKLEDNWRRKNKTVVALDDFEEIDYSESEDIAPKDSIPNSQENEATESSVSPEKDPKKGTTDSIANDTHRPEYYLAQIPLTEEAMQASNALLSEALYGAGMVFKDRMHDFRRAETMFERLIRQFPDFAQADEAYYQLFLTELAIEYYEKKGSSAEKYKAELIARFPESRYAKTLADPDFAENAVHGKQREDSLYVRAYEHFQMGDTATVRAAEHLSS